MGIQSSFSSIIFFVWLIILLISKDTLAAINTTVSSNDYTHALSHRQLQLSGSNAYCLSRGNGQYETVRPFFLFRIFYLFQRRGSCGDLCEDLCNHSPCFSDLKVSSNGDTCTCFDGGVYLCRSNTRCTSNDECICLDGTSGNPVGEGCNDIDECLADNICKAPAAVNCTNTFGTYTCVCAQGYEWKGLSNGGCVDIDECTVNPGICGPSSSNSCTNQPGSYSCLCKNGFQGTSPNCIDIDECAGPGSPCTDKETCVNIPGFYECKCKPGYDNNNAGVCVDVNECLQTNPTVCKPTTEKCFNTEGGYECKCAEGYFDNEPLEAALLCVDIDECVATPNVCGNNSDCSNIPGSYSCRCKRGYTEPSCTPTECTGNGVICGYDALCDIVLTDTNQTLYSCKCPTGFGVNASDACFDIDECTQNATICSTTDQICFNSIGSYRCAKKDWSSCNNKSECLPSSSCEFKYRSEQTNTVCCSEIEECGDKRCCNGAYTMNELCPSKISKDCQSGLVCARANAQTLQYKCCADSFFPPFQIEPLCTSR